MPPPSPSSSEGAAAPNLGANEQRGAGIWPRTGDNASLLSLPALTGAAATVRKPLLTRKRSPCPGDGEGTLAGWCQRWAWSRGMEKGTGGQAASPFLRRPRP